MLAWCWGWPRRSWLMLCAPDDYMLQGNPISVGPVFSKWPAQCMEPLKHVTSEGSWKAQIFFLLQSSNRTSCAAFLRQLATRFSAPSTLRALS